MIQEPVPSGADTFRSRCLHSMILSVQLHILYDTVLNLEPDCCIISENLYLQSCTAITNKGE